jgi:phosphoribosyl 1,2-cyclic phosphodiesterase
MDAPADQDRSRSLVIDAIPPLFAGACGPPSESWRPERARRASRARSAPAVSVCVLGSGSGGNSTALRMRTKNQQTERCVVLVDLGFGSRTTARRLQQAGLDLADVRAACVTHLDRDHFRPSWLKVLADLGIRLCVHHWHLPVLAELPNAGRLFAKGLVETFDREAFDVLPGGELRASGCRVQHDRQGTLAYRFTHACGASVGYATDLGHAPHRLITHLAGVDVLCIESNHDPRMTVNCSRPSFVNRRNLSDSGHLSNDQAFEAVRHIAALSPRGNPKRIVLLHRSSQCNHPTTVRRTFAADARLARRIVLTEQRKRTRWIDAHPRPARERHQLRLAFPGPHLAASA